ncbi:MAG: 2TM domain-containing protein [Bacteroidetes bacterium]|nr:2TM domain-containing protein [Bacteroidota bacterium]
METDALKKDLKKGFIIHCISFIIINAVLIILNIMLSPGYKWFYWSLLGLGVGLISHYIFGFLLINKNIEKK